MLDRTGWGSWQDLTHRNSNKSRKQQKSTSNKKVSQSRGRDLGESQRRISKRLKTDLELM
jgi:hypothetical protein